MNKTIQCVKNIYLLFNKELQKVTADINGSPKGISLL